MENNLFRKAKLLEHNKISVIVLDTENRLLKQYTMHTAALLLTCLEQAKGAHFDRLLSVVIGVIVWQFPFRRPFGKTAQRTEIMKHTGDIDKRQ